MHAPHLGFQSTGYGLPGARGASPAVKENERWLTRFAFRKPDCCAVGFNKQYGSFVEFDTLIG
jgi:hypothetical protein